MNFYLAMSNVSTFLAKEDLETLKLKDQVAIFNEKYKAFDDAVVPLRKSGKTATPQAWIRTRRRAHWSGAAFTALHHLSGEDHVRCCLATLPRVKGLWKDAPP